MGLTMISREQAILRHALVRRDRPLSERESISHLDAQWGWHAKENNSNLHDTLEQQQPHELLLAHSGEAKEASRSFSISVSLYRYPVAHRPVAALALVPHPQQRRVAGVDEVDDAHVGLGGMLPVQTAGVLL
jgi:hypothetical protein